MPRTPGPIRLSFDSGIVELVRTGGSPRNAEEFEPSGNKIQS